MDAMVHIVGATNGGECTLRHSNHLNEISTRRSLSCHGNVKKLALNRIGVYPAAFLDEVEYVWLRRVLSGSSRGKSNAF
jgi:hypothetical protein